MLALCAGATLLIGCPLYSDECDGPNDCALGFYCDQLSQQCQPFLDETGCSRPSQCQSGETCTPDFACRPGSCDFYGCVPGYRCGIVDSAHACVPLGASDAGPHDAGAIDASVPAPVDAGDAAAGPSDAGVDAGLDASILDTFD